MCKTITVPPAHGKRVGFTAKDKIPPVTPHHYMEWRIKLAAVRQTALCRSLPAPLLLGLDSTNTQWNIIPTYGRGCPEREEKPIKTQPLNFQHQKT